MSLAYRPAEERDRPFILASWVDSYRTAHAAGLIAMADWDDVMRSQVGRVLARDGVEAVVAYHPGEDDPRADLYGWLALERNVWLPGRKQVLGRWTETLYPAGCPLVHYVFVKQAYRRQGIARGLFAAAGVDLVSRFLTTCKTGVSTKLAQRLAPLSEWHPLIARYPERSNEPTRSDRDEDAAGQDSTIFNAARRPRPQRGQLGER